LISSLTSGDQTPTRGCALAAILLDLRDKQFMASGVHSPIGGTSSQVRHD
jgi:hypothetical protein